MNSAIETQFQTPPEVCRYMVSLIPEGTKTVLEPTPGQGNIVRELKREGYQITAPEDFFLLQENAFDCIVMNPPFSTKSANMVNAPLNEDLKGLKVGYYFLTECMKLSDRIIALMPIWTITDSDVRMRNLLKYGLKSITLLPRRTFQYARVQTLVLELIKGYQGETSFSYFDRLEKQQSLTLYNKEVA